MTCIVQHRPLPTGDKCPIDTNAETTPADLSDVYHSNQFSKNSSAMTVGIIIISCTHCWNWFVRILVCTYMVKYFNCKVEYLQQIAIWSIRSQKRLWTIFLPLLNNLVTFYKLYYFKYEVLSKCLHCTMSIVIYCCADLIIIY